MKRQEQIFIRPERCALVHGARGRRLDDVDRPEKKERFITSLRIEGSRGSSCLSTTQRPRTSALSGAGGDMRERGRAGCRDWLEKGKRGERAIGEGGKEEERRGAQSAMQSAPPTGKVCGGVLACSVFNFQNDTCV